MKFRSALLTLSMILIGAFAGATTTPAGMLNPPQPSIFCRIQKVGSSSNMTSAMSSLGGQASSSDYFAPGHPCLEESTLYYSDATYNTLVGGNEYICWYGHYVWGQYTNYYQYHYYRECCPGYCAGPWCGVEN